MKLCGRLKAIADMLKGCGTVADIGCDHGFLTAYILENNIAGKVFASDISAVCLAKAERLIARLGLADGCELSVGDGLTVLKRRVDTAVIAGMGGKKISEILSDGRRTDGTKTFVLQPMKNTDRLLKYLTENNYKILDRITVSDRRRYDIIKVVKET
jgi:tRNA (adenine22-N1)-methyltransferase